MTTHNLRDILLLMEEYQKYLNNNDVQFNQEGFPIFTKDMFLEQWPRQVVPYDRRNSLIIENPKETVLCHYDRDDRIYPRLEKVLNELDVYHCYMGMVFPDVTITEDMDPEWQGLTMLLNQMFAMVAAVNVML